MRKNTWIKFYKETIYIHTYIHYDVTFQMTHSNSRSVISYAPSNNQTRAKNSGRSSPKLVYLFDFDSAREIR